MKVHAQMKAFVNGEHHTVETPLSEQLCTKVSKKCSDKSVETIICGSMCFIIPEL